MQTFDALLRQAVSGFLASNLSLTEEAAGKASQNASIQLLRKICALALDPSVEDAQALVEVRALCTQAQLFFREQGMEARPIRIFFPPDPFRRTISFPPRYTERTAYPMRAHFISRTARAVNPTTLPPTNSSGDFFIRSKGSQKFLKFA